jgi:2-amino-4-hydroxy-6-hydroxymethyldihydropteridine diphosphokinase
MILTGDNVFNSVDAYIALGANLGDPVSQIREAVSRLDSVQGVSVLSVSPVSRTKPVGGPQGQPDYFNAVAKTRTSLAPMDLLAHCQEIENDQGRIRTVRWGARTIDLDLLLYGAEVIDTQILSIPHPRMRERLFVLVPFCDVAGESFAIPPDGVLAGKAVLAAAEKSGESLSHFIHKKILIRLF